MSEPATLRQLRSTKPTAASSSLSWLLKPILRKGSQSLDANYHSHDSKVTRDSDSS